jgi:hypothetical protein
VTALPPHRFAAGDEHLILILSDIADSGRLLI